MQGNLKSEGGAEAPAEPDAPKPAPAAAAAKPRTKPALVEDAPTAEAAPRPAQRRRPPAA